MTLYGADEKPLPPSPPTRKERCFRSISTWWKAVPKAFKTLLGFLAALGVILTFLVRLDDMRRLLHRSEARLTHPNGEVKPHSETGSLASKAQSWQPPELPKDCTNITVHFGGWMSYAIALQQLKTNETPRAFRDGGLEFPFRPYVESNRLYIEIEAPFGKTTVLMREETAHQLKGVNRDLGWDWNFSSNAYEIVRLVQTKDGKTYVPTLQVHYETASDIFVSGLLTWNTNQMILAFGGDLNRLTNGLADWGIIKEKPMFKYPGWNHRGMFAE